MRTRIKKSDKYNNLKLEDPNLNVNGQVKKTVVSFQCEYKLWNDFDEMVESEYGKYKKSLIIEDLIRKYMAKKNKIAK